MFSSREDGHARITRQRRRRQVNGRVIATAGQQRQSTLRRTMACLVVGLLLCGTGSCTRRALTPPPSAVPFDSIFATKTSVMLASSIADSLINPTSAAVVGDDVIVVDIGAADLKVFSRSTGRLLRIIGSPGDVVGAFRQPIGISLLDDSTYAVLDHRRRIVSIRSTTSSNVRELAIDGAWNGIAPSPRPRHFVLAGTPGSYANNPSLSLHEFDLEGRQTAACGARTKARSEVEASFSTPFLGRFGNDIMMGTYSSNRVQICHLETAREHHVDVAPGWYRPIVWPAHLRGPGTGIELVSTWARHQRLMIGVFSLRAGQFTAQFQVPDNDGVHRYAYVVADTLGRTLAISEPTDRQVLESHADTVYWIARPPSVPAHLGVSVRAAHETTIATTNTGH